MTNTYIKIIHNFQRKGREMWAGGDWLKLKPVFDLSRIRRDVWMLIELRRKHVVLLCECTMFQHTMMESESHSSSAWPAVACDAVFYLFVGFEDYHGQIQNSQNALPWYWSRNTEQDDEGCSQACCSELEFYKGMEKWFDLKCSQVFLLGQLVIDYSDTKSFQHNAASSVIVSTLQ